MDSPLELLDTILSQSQPQQTVWLTPDQAEQIAQLDEREIGPIATASSAEDVIQALVQDGLFGRIVIITAERRSPMITGQSEPAPARQKGWGIPGSNSWS